MKLHWASIIWISQGEYWKNISNILETFFTSMTHSWHLLLNNFILCSSVTESDRRNHQNICFVFGRLLINSECCFIKVTDIKSVFCQITNIPNLLHCLSPCQLTGSYFWLSGHLWNSVEWCWKRPSPQPQVLMSSEAGFRVHRFEIGAWPTPGDLDSQFPQTCSPSLPWPLAIFSVYSSTACVAFTRFPIHWYQLHC